MIPESIFVTTLVIAVTQLIKLIRKREWESTITLISAGLIGAGSGFLGIEGLDIISGTIVGLSAAGIVTVAEKVSGEK